MRRILLVLAVALVMVAMAAPSAVANHGTQYCFIPSEFAQPQCYDDRGECEKALEAALTGVEQEGEEEGGFVSSECYPYVPSDPAYQHNCQDPADAREECRVNPRA